MAGFNYEKFKEALKRREEESFAALKAEVAKVRDNVEKMLALFCESSANQARTNYSGLEMY